MRGRFAFRHVLRDSRFGLGFSLVLALCVHAIHDLLGLEALEVPALPVTAIGIVVSIYLGFQINVTCRRWWEARGI